MATKIVTKNSSTASAVPTASDLVQGELAVNVADKRLFTEDNGGSIVELGTNPSGNVTFQDNGKAIFGAGSDLQIYHDGNNSYIDESATGSLLIRGSNLQLRSYGTNEYFFTGVENGASTIYYDGLNKLATTSTGIDVTGTATMDGLSVDGDILVNRTSSFTNAAVEVQDEGAGEVLALNNNGTDGQFLRLYNSGTLIGGLGNNTSSVSSLHIYRGSTPAINIDNATGDISFYEDTGTTAKLFWDASAESLGIGTSSPSAKLTVSGTGVGAAIDWTNTTASTGRSYRWVSLNNGTGFALEDLTDNTERMRIDSSGNLLVGKTSTSGNTVGAELRSNGGIFGTKDGAYVARFNRKTSDGSIVELQKDGTTVGSIGTTGGDLNIGTGDTGLQFWDGGDSIYAFNTSTNSGRDAAVDLGYSGARFKNLFLSSGVYLGGTGAANKLDDYESGTFTATVAGSSTAGSATYPTQGGTYEKIGDMVHFRLYMQWYSGTGGGSLKVGGLPFTSSSESTSYESVTIGYIRDLTFSGVVTAYTEVNSTTIIFRENFTSATGNNLTYDVSGRLMLSGSYRAA